VQNSPKKIAPVTGANKGIGFEMARQTGRTGVTVLLGARHSAGEGAATALIREGGAADFMAVEVADYASFEAAAAIASGVGQVDVLLNNAGIHHPSMARP
jgi:NAD(P)-dependent dehydrogenase (short-subunit alcohol dehydrogenase family)